MTPHPDKTHHALAGCGERLKQAREAAGLSIDDVAARLHMPARIVRSLEAEDWSRLGAPVFVRGQVRSYSRLMGLMTAPMMDALVDVGPVEPSRIVSRTHTPKAQWWAEQLGRRLVYIVLTLFLVVPAWVATRQHLANTGDGAPLDVPVRAAVVGAFAVMGLIVAITGFMQTAYAGASTSTGGLYGAGHSGGTVFGLQGITPGPRRGSERSRGYRAAERWQQHLPRECPVLFRQ